MANNYYEATGVLVLDRVTPVIQALFGAFALDESHPGNGQAYIAQIAETTNPQWPDVLDGLEDLATQLGIPMPDDEGLSIPPLLELLAVHFRADEDEELGNLIDRHSFEDTADLDALFLIATRFDDGHHLTAIQFEGCWYCSKPRLFEFGGNGCYLSREVRFISSSSQALQLGDQLRKTIVAADIEEASALIALETINLLAGVICAGASPSDWPKRQRSASPDAVSFLSTHRGQFPVAGICSIIILLEKSHVPESQSLSTRLLESENRPHAVHQLRGRKPACLAKHPPEPAAPLRRGAGFFSLHHHQRLRGGQDWHRTCRRRTDRRMRRG